MKTKDNDREIRITGVLGEYEKNGYHDSDFYAVY